MTPRFRCYLLAATLVTSVTAYSYAQGESPPHITAVTYEIQKWLGYGYSAPEPFVPGVAIGYGDSVYLANWQPGVDVARMGDIIWVQIDFIDLDLSVLHLGDDVLAAVYVEPALFLIHVHGLRVDRPDHACQFVLHPALPVQGVASHPVPGDRAGRLRHARILRAFVGRGYLRSV